MLSCYLNLLFQKRGTGLGVRSITFIVNQLNRYFLASWDAIEPTWVSESVGNSKNQVDWCGPGKWRYQLKTLLMRHWQLMILMEMMLERLWCWSWRLTRWLLRWPKWRLTSRLIDMVVNVTKNLLVSLAIGGQIYHWFKWRQMLGNFATNTSSASCWPNFKLLPPGDYLIAQPDDLFDIDIWISISLYFDTQMTEKYSTAMC